MLKPGEESQMEVTTLQPKITIAETPPIDKKPSVVFCKICLSGSSTEQLLQPCICKGSMGHVHLTCLERWLSERSDGVCELCHFQFNINRTRRYTVWRALVIWAQQPTHRSILYTDCVILLVMTLVMAVLVVSVILEYQTYPEVTTETDVSIYYLISLFVAVALFGYGLATYMIITENIEPWYRWWSNCTEIRLNREQLPTEQVL